YYIASCALGAFESRGYQNFKDLGCYKDETNEEKEAFMKDKVTDASSGSEIRIDAIITATKPPNRRYPLSKDACQKMLKMKLQDGAMDEVCYQLLKMIEKQAGLRK
ncbi:hypothetical protein Tco_1567048, partial [Tanacetum coccineum]